MKLIRKFCNKCRREIFEKDDFIHLEEYFTGNKERETWFHKRCWEDINKPKKLAMALAARAGKLMGMAEDRMGGGREEFVVK